MNQITNKNKKKQMSEELLDKVLRFYDEGKSASDILVLFPDHKEELSQIFKSINILKKQKDIVSAPKEFLAKIVSDISFGRCDSASKKMVSVAGVTSIKDNRYLFESDYLKGRFFNFNILKLFTMKKIYIGFAVFLLLTVVVAGVSYRQSHRKGSIIVANLPIEETNKLVQDQEVLSQDIADLEGIGADDVSLGGVNQDLADISGEQVAAEESSNNNKTIDMAYIETLESGFGLEIANLSSDSQDLEGINGDTSLSALDSELSGI